MLAQPYGYASVLSGFAFTCPSGPSDPEGWTTNVVCASSFETAVKGQWVCEHRDPHILRMIGFRRRVAGTDIVNWWDNGANAIAFSRGTKGNRETTTVTQTITTPLAPGSYCDLITGGKVGAACAGTELTVTAQGTVTISLAANTAVAIDLSTKR